MLTCLWYTCTCTCIHLNVMSGIHTVHTWHVHNMVLYWNMFVHSLPSIFHCSLCAASSDWISQQVWVFHCPLSLHWSSGGWVSTWLLRGGRVHCSLSWQLCTCPRQNETISKGTSCITMIINPWRTCTERVTVFIQSVCLLPRNLSLVSFIPHK